MLEFTSEDAVNVLMKSGNLNAALKHFLKREIQNGDPAGRFVKDLRTFVDKPNTTQFKAYVDRMRGKFELQLIAIGGYAHSNLVSSIASQVVEKYADDFNKTYETEGETVKIKDQKGFDAIVKDVFGIIDGELKGAGLGESQFLRNSILVNIFDRPVLQKILKK